MCEVKATYITILLKNRILMMTSTVGFMKKIIWFWFGKVKDQTPKLFSRDQYPVS